MQTRINQVSDCIHPQTGACLDRFLLKIHNALIPNKAPALILILNLPATLLRHRVIVTPCQQNSA